MTVGQWIVIVGAIPAIAYGVLNVVTPATTIRWQKRATERASEGDPRKALASVSPTCLASAVRKIQQAIVLSVGASGYSAAPRSWRLPSWPLPFGGQSADRSQRAVAVTRLAASAAFLVVTLAAPLRRGLLRI